MGKVREMSLMQRRLTTPEPEHTSRLCAVPWLRPVLEPTPLPIVCRPLLSIPSAIRTLSDHRTTLLPRQLAYGA